MSTILNALRRLEADEQRKAESQEISSGEPPRSAGSGWRGFPLWALAVGVLLVGAGLGIGLRELTGGAPEPVPVVAHSPQAAVEDSEVAQRPAPQTGVPAEVSLRPEPSVAPEPETVPSASPPVVSQGVREPAPIPVVVREVVVEEPAPGAAEPMAASGALAAAGSLSETAPAPAEANEMAAEITPIADGPVRVVSELPVAEPPPAPTPKRVEAPVSAEPSARQASAEAQKTLPPAPAPVETPVQKPAQKPVEKVVSAVPVPPKAATPSPQPDVPKTEPKPVEEPKPVASSETKPPTPIAAPPAAIELPPLSVVVLSTVWHPRPEKRSARLSADGLPSEMSFGVGDLWQGWQVAEIKLSGVVFERDELRIERRVGDAP